MPDETSQQPESEAAIDQPVESASAAPSPPPAQPTEAEDHPVEPEQPYDFKAHPGFWQKPAVVNAVSFGTSLLVHVAVIAVGIATAKAVQQIATVVREQIIIPDATIIEGAEVGGIPNPGLGGDPTREAAQDQFADVAAAANSLADRPSQTLTSSLMGGGAGDSAGDSVIGIGAGQYGAGRGTGTGRGSGAGSGTGDSTGGALAPFGVPGGGGGIGPKSPFMGISGNAKKIVYLCDASGSMMGVFPALQYELRKAIDVLKPIQGFNVIFYSADDVHFFSQHLAMANPENKRKAYAFIDGIAPMQGTDPYKAIDMAFSNKPELMYILTDGFDAVGSYAMLLERFRKLNADKSVKINTILIRDEMVEEELIDLLRTIADENGGLMKSVGVDEVGG